MSEAFSLDSGNDISRFQAFVYAKAKESHRDLPWRKTKDPYAILISEVMLQQTQARRVVPKFEAWMEVFPNLFSLARADLSHILALWSGLGYNRRALALHKAAVELVVQFNGQVPAVEAQLRSLPGIGMYTSRAILAFAYDIPTVFLETNVRTVLIKHMFSEAQSVSDSDLFPVAERVLDRTAPARWYNALMDYGAELKRLNENHGNKAKAYGRQSPFSTSFRRIRGEMLKKVISEGSCDIDSFHAAIPFSLEDVENCARILAKEGFLVYEGRTFRLVGTA
jgi:A/G-specific adenine glycosylase